VTIDDFNADKEHQNFIKKVPATTCGGERKGKKMKGKKKRVSLLAVQNLGDDVLRVTHEKVEKLLADKNKQTLAPNAE
jgi:hypothetical protein